MACSISNDACTPSGHRAKGRRSLLPLLLAGTVGCVTEAPAEREVAPPPPPPAQVEKPEAPKRSVDVCLVYPTKHAQIPEGPYSARDAQRAFEEGLAKEQAGDRAAALEAYHRAVALDASHGLAHLGAAENHLYIDNAVGEMRTHLASAVKLLPANPRAHLMLAQLATETGDPDVALTHCRCALELKPTYAKARLLLARQLMANRRASEAEAELRRLLQQPKEQLDGATTSARVMLSDALAAQGKLLDAAQLLESVARELRTAALYRRAANLYQAAKSPLSAKRLRAQADRLDPPPRERKMRPLRKRRRRKKKKK